MNILVLFESDREGYCFKPLVESLKETHEVTLHVVSVYNDLRKIENMLHKHNYDLVVAGSGLAASLPGVVASLTKVPVFGLPVETHFGGIDALLSMLQMPMGNPVLTAKVGGHNEIVQFVSLIDSKLKKLDMVNLIIDGGVMEYEYMNNEINRTRVLCEDKGLELRTSGTIDKDCFNICLVTDPDMIHANDMCLHVPVLENTMREKPTEAFMIYEWIDKGGIWLGVDNARNAVLSFLRLRTMVENKR